MNNLLQYGAMEAAAAAGDKTAEGQPRAGLMARIQASLKNPVLVGESGARARYLRVQWWVTFWRLLILIQIPEVALVQPERFRSMSHAFELLAAGLAYAIIYYWLATRSEAAGKMSFHIADLLVCSILLMMAHDDKLLFIMSFYSYSSLLARPSVLFREMVPATVALSLVYIAAYWLSGFNPLSLFSVPRELDGFALYYFWGLGFVGFSAVLERASSLELDTRLEEQRQSYRRRLHDDLGNTLCGLHFRIQSLRRISTDELKKALRFLAGGYDRANRVLSHLLTGLDDQPIGDLTDSLHRLKRELKRVSGLELRLAVPAATVTLSPEVGREVLAIVREAVANAAKHSDVSEVDLEVKKRFGRLSITILDRGDGFDQSELALRQSTGSKGIKGMRERAGLIKGQLEIDSRKGAGTAVTLKVDVRRRTGMLGRVLDYDPESSLSGIYPFLVRLRFFMFVWTMIELSFRPSGKAMTVPLAIVTAGLALDCLAWVILRSPLHSLITRRPWLLLVENAGFVALIYIAMQANIPFFFPLYVGVAVIMNGLFLEALGNLALTIFLNAGIIAAYVLAPAAAVDSLPGGRFESPLQHSTIFVILAVSAGLAGEFIKSLEGLQFKAVVRALARQKELLTAETHRQLHSLVNSLGEEISHLAKSEPRTLDVRKLKSIEYRSTDLKTRLRSILRSLDEPVDTRSLIMDSGAAP